VLYQSETDFGRVDIYRSLARELGLEPSYRRAQLWRDIKRRVHEMVDSKQLTPLWIIDEAQNLPAEFFRDSPSFLNFAFDSRDLMTVWLVSGRRPHSPLPQSRRTGNPFDEPKQPNQTQMPASVGQRTDTQSTSLTNQAGSRKPTPTKGRSRYQVNIDRHTDGPCKQAPTKKPGFLSETRPHFIAKGA
jgi:hypothetical protein